jgi:hypothetical protein
MRHLRGKVRSFKQFHSGVQVNGNYEHDHRVSWSRLCTTLPLIRILLRADHTPRLWCVTSSWAWKLFRTQSFTAHAPEFPGSKSRMETQAYWLEIEYVLFHPGKSFIAMVCQPAVPLRPSPTRITPPLMDPKSASSPSKESRPYELFTFIQEDPALSNQRKKHRTLTACDRW